MSNNKLQWQVASKRNSPPKLPIKQARKQPELLPWRVGMVVGVMGNNVSGLRDVLTEDARRLGFALLKEADNGTGVHEASRFVLDLRMLATSLHTAALVDLRVSDPARMAAMAGTHRHSARMANDADVLDFIVADFAPFNSDERDNGRNYMGSSRYLVSSDGDVISLARLTLPLPNAGALNAPIDLEVQHRLECEETEADASEKGEPR
jgi:hypothetical protein